MLSVKNTPMALVTHIPLTAPKNLLTDVENRSVYNLQNCELNVFETYRQSEQVHLAFHDLVITSMVRGKKVMHLPGLQQFDYWPGETVLAPAGTHMYIDFPEAHEQSPTQCIALTLDNDAVRKTIDQLNELYPKSNEERWGINFHLTHLKNSAALADVINKMIAVCREKTATKDILADLTMKELIVRLMQLQNLELLHAPSVTTTGPFQYVTAYMREHISEKQDIDQLSKKACMSRTQFFRTFKREFGITPIQFIIKERLKRAKQLLTEHTYSIQQVSMETGFDDVNNFIKTFKKNEGITPGSFRKNIMRA